MTGDIAIVYKAPSWGIATVSNAEGRRTSLTFKQLNDVSRLATDSLDRSPRNDLNSLSRTTDSKFLQLL